MSLVTVSNGSFSIINGSVSIGGITGPTAILIGYIQATTPAFINDCTATFTNVLCTVPLYVSSNGA